MSHSIAYLKTSFMLSPLYHPSTATGRAAGRLVSGLRGCSSTLHLSPTTSCASTTPFLHHDRHFSVSGSQQLKIKEFFARPKNENINYSPPAWPHPVYTESQLKSITFQHRAPRDFSDRVALALMRLLRFTLDKATFYAHESSAPSSTTSATRSDSTDAPTKAVTTKSWLTMTERKWLIRLVFLESVAGVPGMVGGMLRHLRSLRLMRRDNGWIETLLEEAYNERMHLLTFLSLAEPGPFMRAMVLLAQGVFFNSFFLSYLVSPRTCHRFVGYLEEEAVLTYSRIIRDLEAGKLPAWEEGKVEVPDIAVHYWRMPEGKRTMRDLLYYVRADEAKHREVNHTLGNLKQDCDPNPYTSEYKDKDKRVHPTKGLEHHHPTGWERAEVM